MYVSRIKVAGLRCFSGPRAVDLAVEPGPGWTVLAGPNGSGKSTLLRALALALGAHPPVDPAHWIADGSSRAEVDLPGAGRWSTDGPLRSPHAAARLLDAGRTAPDRLGAATARLLEDGVLPDGWRVTDPDRALVAPPGGPARPLADLGSGIAGLAAVVAALAGDAAPTGPADAGCTVPLRAVALIDDVDLHLHPRWQQQIGGWLTARFPEVQFLVATHSPYVCQAADPGTLVRLAGPAEAAPPRVLDEDVHQRVLYGSGDDTALSELFGLPSAYSAAAEAERQLLVRLERKLYAGRATSDELDAYRRLGAKLNSSLAARADELSARLLGEQP
ncbi:AAA family ATPase [Kitasatospora sp. NPDC059571]|uniref:AAA family ATPase n=1 Tax=Kitasatospora sp. NPDC059571 TaxID=3346871 RepID=UPI0036D1DA2D